MKQCIVFKVHYMSTLLLYRPVGPGELALIAASGWQSFPPRLAEQPIFYPVLTESYAVQIAREWNVKAGGKGYVTRFELDAAYASRFPVQKVGGADHLELWVPAEELEEFNRHVVGSIEVIHEYPGESEP